MKTKIDQLKRLTYGVVASALMAVALLPSLSGQVAAAGQMTSRSIKMSDSTVGASSVSYQVGFTPATSATIKGIVVDFCAGTSTPIVGDTCTAPTGFSVGTPTVDTATAPDTGLGSGWTAGSLNSGRTLTLTNTTGVSLSSSTPVIFTLSTATNPSSTAGTFYARILTYTTTTGATGYTAGTEGSFTDAAGIALSTAANINITAKVQEQISFCVYTNANCAAGGTAVTLGDSHGVLDSQNAYVDKSAKYDLSTNAQTGAIIRMKGVTLTSGSATIAAIGGTAAASNPGNAQFGLCSYISSGSNLTISSPYTGDNSTVSCDDTSQGIDGDGGAKFAFDTNTTDGTGSTYGDELASCSGATTTNTGAIAYIANIPTDQQAGIYTTSMTFIATGTY